MEFKKLTYAFLLASVLTTTTGIACTKVMRADHEPAVVVGRNMDWDLDRIPGNLWVYPRGIERNGMSLDKNSLKWRSKYGSIATSSYDRIYPITSDGMNEEGLAVHLNALVVSKYGKRNPDIPGLNIMLWGQYFLDNFKTVDEAVRYASTNAFQIIPMRDPSGREVPIHLGIEDATGDAAVFEYIDGELHVYHDRQYTTMTNDPTYDEQLKNLKQYKGYGGTKDLPGTTSAADRFVRANYYAAHLPEYKTAREEVTGMFSVIENVTQPEHAGSPERPGRTKTVWRTVSDLTNRTYYFVHMRGHNLIYVSLNQFDLREGAPKKRLLVQEREDLHGDVAKLFEDVK